MSATEKHRLKDKTIMIVDDDPDFLFQQETFLKNSGCSVISASNRKEAEALLDGERPDAVIVDLMIDEDDDGFVLAYKAKQAFPGIPVVMVTGVAGEKGISFDASTAEERKWIKADRVLQKPVRAEQIIGELKKMLGE